MRRSTKWILRTATPEEYQNWNTHILNNPGGGSILQTTDFAAIKKAQGWQPHYLIFETPKKTIAALALARTIPFLGAIWYFPKGPSVARLEDLDDAFQALRDYIQTHKVPVFLVKVEPELSKQDDTHTLMTRAGFSPASFIQANASTIILDVYATPEEQMQHLGRRARRYIRRAQREGVTVERMLPTAENFQQMYQFMQTAYGGRGIPGLRPYEYYEDFWHAYIQDGTGRLYFGFEDGTPTVGVFIVLLGQKAIYKDGGSATGRDAKGTAYFIHWYIMNEVSKEGITHYDLWGAPPSDQVDNTHHPLWGIGNFKTAFSKDILDYMGVWDGAIAHTRYVLWKVFIYKAVRFTYRLRRRSFW